VLLFSVYLFYHMTRMRQALLSNNFQLDTMFESWLVVAVLILYFF